MVTIEAFGHVAMFDGIQWRSNDAALAELLATRLRFVEREISPAVGRRDLYVANDAIAELAPHTTARIVSVSPAPALPPDVIL